MSTAANDRPPERHPPDLPPDRLPGRTPDEPAPPRTALRRHLRAALVGTLLAIVAITGLSAYAAQGVADARSAAPCQARIACR